MLREAFRPALAVATLLTGAAGSNVFAAGYATVVSSTPVTAQVPVARQVCSPGRQYVQQPPSGAGALIGAIAGGVLGNSVGGGFGRAAATGLGVVAGSVMGNQVEAGGAPVSEVPVQRCQLVNQYENRTLGYDVVYEYAGQRYSTRMANDPGQRFAVNVQPADAAHYALPAPIYRDASPVPAAPYPAIPYPADSQQAASYDPLPPPVYAEQGPRAVYYGPSPIVYAAPVIGFGLGYYGGYGYRGRHWH